MWLIAVIKFLLIFFNVLNELDTIELIGKLFRANTPDGVLGIGDDCAVIPLSASEALVVSTDMLTEESHFRLSTISAFDLGRKALAVNLSDIAAMGATPYCSFLSVALSPSINQEWIENFTAGYRSISLEYGVALLGGDTTFSPLGVTINITIMGRGALSTIKKRSGAFKGDIVMVSGTLGSSACGLKVISMGLEHSGSCYSAMALAHRTVSPAIKQGQFFAMQEGVHSMMDISDGIAKDLRHILLASGVGANIELSKLPMDDSMRMVCAKEGWDAAELALCGGEDYRLLLTANSKDAIMIQDSYKNLFGTPLYPIGTITDASCGLRWLQDGVSLERDYFGYTHKNVDNES